MATVGSASTFHIRYNNGTSNALRVEDNSGIEFQSDDGTNYIQVLDSAITATANSGSGGLVTLNDTSASIGTASTGIYVDTTAVNVTTDALALYGDTSSTVAELRLQEASTNGINYVAFKAPTTLAGNSTYILPSSSSDGLMINGSSTLSWGTATNAHLSAGVGGIYKGSGTIATSAIATLTAASDFEIAYSNTNTAIGITDSTGGIALQSGTNSRTLTVDPSKIELVAPYTNLMNQGGAAQELRFLEPSGTNYSAFKAQAQTTDVTYTLPSAAPASNGYVLSSTTAGAMSWVAQTGADGNGIYGGSGTIASAAVATITASSSFTIDWSNATNALHFADTAGTYQLNDETGANGVYGTSTTSELFSNEAYLRLSASGGGTDTNMPLNILLGHLSMNSVVSPAQITANQNNYGPAGLETANVLRLNSDASRNITGLTTVSATKVAGWVLTIHNIGSFNIVLKNEDANSTAAYRFALGADVTIGAGQSHTLIYDNTSSRWRSFVTDTSGTGTTDLTFTGASSPVTLNSSTGTDVTFTAGTGISLSATSTDLTITNSSPGVTDHGALGGLSDDDHSIYALLGGRATGQILTGGTASGDDLTLRSTTNATKGDIILNDQGGNVIIGGAATASALRFMEPSGSGTNYTEFIAAAQGASQQYILPTDAPANGEFLR